MGVTVLAASRHPASGEALAPVVSWLREQGHEAELFAVPNDRPETENAGGAAAVFERLGIGFQRADGVEGGLDPLRFDPVDAERMIGEHDPDVVLVGSSYDPSGEHFGIEDALIAASPALGVPSVQVVDTIGTWFPRKRGGSASIYAVESDFAKRVIESRGAQGDRIRITGQPGLDGLLDDRAGSVERQSGDSRVIGFFTQGDPDNLDPLDWVIHSLGEHDRLIISPHPRDRQDYAHMIGDRVSMAEVDSHTLLDSIDVCVTRYSLMGLKAALRGIPTINSLTTEDWADVRHILSGFPLALAEGSVEVHTEAEMRDVMPDPPDPNVKSVKEWFRIDGQATRRVAELVVDCSNGAG